MKISSDLVIYTTVFALSFITFFGFIKIGVERIAEAVTARPLRYIVISLAVVGVLGIGIKNLALEPDVKVLVPENMPGRMKLDRIEKLFGGVDTVYLCITAENGTIWDAHILSRIHDMSGKLKTSPYVDNLLSITETKSITNEDDMMKVNSVVEDGMDFSAPDALERVRKNAMANSVLYKRLISPDERSTLIVANVNLRRQTTTGDGKTKFTWVQDKELCELVPGDLEKPTLLNIIEKYKDPSYSVRVTGFPYFRYNMWMQMNSDMKVFLVLGVIVMLAFLYASFRTFRGMLLPLVVVLLSLAASFGFMGWMGEKITLPFLIMGPMLIAIAHNYGTQLIAKYYEDVQDAKGSLKEGEARCIAGRGIVSIGAPVLISAITVVIGFVTMISHPVRGLALLGFFCAFGIIAAFILTILFHTAILSYISIPRMLLERPHGAMTDRVLKAVALFTIRRRYGMLACVLLLMTICICFIPRMETDSNIMNQFPKSTAIYKDAKFISDNFGGYSTLNVLIEAAHPVSSDSPEDGPIKNPEILKWVDGLQRFAMGLVDPRTNERLIGDALSMTDFISYMNMVMKNDPKEYRIPDSRNLIAQYLLSYENQSNGDFSSLVDYKYNRAQSVLRLPDMSMPRLHALISSLEQYVRDHPNRDIHVTFGGTAELNTELGAMIVDGQIWSLVLSVLIIIVCYMIFFRSFSAGMLAAVPLFCAIVMVFGIMGAMKIPLDYITATLTGISIGAGTDYTAYFLWRLRERTQLTGDLERGYVETMTSIGKGIIYNGFSVVTGFFVFFLSNFIAIRFFGFLVSFSIFACIVSTLTILPVVIFIQKPEFLLQRAQGPGVLEAPVRRPAHKPRPRSEVMLPYSSSPRADNASEGR
jgi:hydrophobe/amphiphile efflux-3 (HAE3) family protein